MFNLQGGEIVIVLLLALVVLGPEKLPDAMRKAGRAYAELRKVATGFQDEFRKAVNEPVQEVSNSVRETANLLRESADFTKLAAGERPEKPKSAEMPSVPLVAPADPTQVPSDNVPTFEGAAETAPAGGGPAPDRPVTPDPVTRDAADDETPGDASA